jgi:glucuronate isomerase
MQGSMAASFLDENFLLTTSTSRTLFHEVAASQPIIDYHCHLSPADIARDRRFGNLWEAWLEGDHYKWRALRTNGVAERFCTGDADPYEKFLAFARTVPMTLRNPLFHWTHLELQRYFGIYELLDEKSAPRIWEEANAQLTGGDLTVHGIFRRMKVEVVCTTDDPADDLEHHRKMAETGGPVRMLPAFRPDKAMQLRAVEDWNQYVDRLATVAGVRCDDFAGFTAALAARHDFFHAMGARVSDHGLNYCPGLPCGDEEAAAIFRRARAGEAPTESEEEKFGFWLMLFFGRMDAAKGWVQQLHLGAQRNNSPRQLRALGRDTGFDSIGDWPQAHKLATFLGQLDETGELPRTILYNLNPADNYVFGTMVGNFNDGSVAGKVQFGTGWWFLDQLEGMTWQINALSNLGLLSRFVGMLTDSRSFLSFPRHEYFRRLLCDLLGREAEAGLLPSDLPLLREYVERISYRNAREYFDFWPEAS